MSKIAVDVTAAHVTAAQVPENGKVQQRSYDLDSKDFFWAKNAASPFPNVAEEIDAELTKCASSLPLCSDGL